jgi:hypothetical protein
MLSGISQSLDDDIQALPWLAPAQTNHIPAFAATPNPNRARR